MKYYLYRTDGPPPAEQPVGMSNLLGIGHYQSALNAMRFMRRPTTQHPGFTHLGLHDDNGKLVHKEQL